MSVHVLGMRTRAGESVCVFSYAYVMTVACPTHDICSELLQPSVFA